MALINKSGFDSNRNLSKPWKPARILPNGKVHPLDNLPLKADGSRVLSNGVLGVRSTGGGVKGLSIVVRRGAGGKMRSPAKSKNVSRIGLSKTYKQEFENQSKTQLIQLRAALISWDLFSQGTMPDKYREIIIKISQYLTNHLSQAELEDLFKKDENRKRSIVGIIKSGNVKIEQVKSAGQRVQRALHNMRYFEKYE